MANILIIGKEASISKEKDEIQYNKEILNNLKDWCNIKDFNTDLIKEKDWDNYSPLYPYKGQMLKVINKQNNNDGTSRTWYNYQKLLNYIFKNNDNKLIDFHINAFITEVNSTPSRKTINANTDSITFRKENILTSKFFRSFPIVIISGVGYFKSSNGINEIEKIFKVSFTEKKYANLESKSQPYWIHKSKEKIVINTHQLSIGVSDDLLKKVAIEIINSNFL